MTKRQSTFLVVNLLLAGASATAMAQPKPAPAPAASVPAQPAPVAKAPVAPAATKPAMAVTPAPVAAAKPAATTTTAAAAPIAPATAKTVAAGPATAPPVLAPPVAASPALIPGVRPAVVAPAVAPSSPATVSGAPAAASAPVVALPKPAPELEQMKILEGNWRCDGRAPAGPSGPEHAYKSTWKFKRDLDNFWWLAEYQQTKAKAHPAPMKARGYMTYDSSNKTFMLVGVDNMGGSSTESTSGWSGDVVTLAGDASMAGKKIPYREVITKKGTREFTWRGEMKMGGDWVTLGEDRCKK